MHSISSLHISPLLTDFLPSVIFVSEIESFRHELGSYFNPHLLPSHLFVGEQLTIVLVVFEDLNQSGSG
jgi:hypothetical protein